MSNRIFVSPDQVLERIYNANIVANIPWEIRNSRNWLCFDIWGFLHDANDISKCLTDLKTFQSHRIICLVIIHLMCKIFEWI